MFLRSLSLSSLSGDVSFYKDRLKYCYRGIFKKAQCWPSLNSTLWILLQQQLQKQQFGANYQLYFLHPFDIIEFLQFQIPLFTTPKLTDTNNQLKIGHVDGF